MRVVSFGLRGWIAKSSMRLAGRPVRTADIRRSKRVKRLVDITALTENILKYLS
jgi:hypothetical protein